MKKAFNKRLDAFCDTCNSIAADLSLQIAEATPPTRSITQVFNGYTRRWVETPKYILEIYQDELGKGSASLITNGSIIEFGNWATGLSKNLNSQVTKFPLKEALAIANSWLKANPSIWES